jgi:hypothetical protein
MIRIIEMFAQEQLRTGAGPLGNNLGQNDQSDFEDQQQQDPVLKAAPYVKLLSKLGYEFQNHDEDAQGGMIGSSFQGPDGDMILVKQDGSWSRFGPGAQRSQGADPMALGSHLVKQSFNEGDDNNHHHALRTAGYQKIHSDDQGNSYYKHPQHGKSVTVGKDGRWGSSAGTGRGAGKLREFLGNEKMDNEDPQMQQMKLKQQQMKQQSQQQRQGAGPQKPGTRGSQGTRGGGGGRF